MHTTIYLGSYSFYGIKINKLKKFHYTLVFILHAVYLVSFFCFMDKNKKIPAPSH